MNNPAAESLLLSCFINYPQTFFDVADYMSESDFDNPGHAAIYLALASLYLEREADKISKLKIIAEAKTLGFDNFKSLTRDYQFLDQIFDNIVQETDVSRYLVDVKRQAILRKYENEFSEKLRYIRNTTDDLTKIISTIEEGIFNVPDIADQGQHALIKIAKNARNVIMQLAESPGQVGLDVGLPIWQNKIGQIRNAGVTFIVASAKTGKSQFGFKAGIHVAQYQRLPVLIADSELSKEQQTVRLVGIMADVPYQVLETGYWKLNDEQLRAEGIPEAEIPQYAEYRRRMNNQVFWDKVSALPIDYMSIAGLPMEEVLPRIRRWILTTVKPSRDAKYPECFIIYDYIKLATMDELKGGKSEHQVHGINMAMLHEMCKRYNVPVMAFGQTNRELDTDINCVAGAKRLVDNATSISLIKRKSDDELGFDPTGDHLIRVFASRFGPGTPNGHININFDKSRGQLHELGYSSIDFAAKKAEKLKEFYSKRKSKHDDDDDD